MANDTYVGSSVAIFFSFVVFFTFGLNDKSTNTFARASNEPAHDRSIPQAQVDKSVALFFNQALRSSPSPEFA